MQKFSKYVFGATLFGALLMSFGSMAQIAMPAPPADPPKNWHTMDLSTDGFFGISLNQAYIFVKGKKSKTVLVATIDSGIDTAQKDLQGILWVNSKEIPGNGIDDDGDGYVDDVHGWDFLGGKNGKCDYTETTEEVREYAKLKDKYASLTSAPSGDEKGYNYWLEVKAVHDSTVNKSSSDLKELRPEMNALMVSNGYIKKALNLSPDATFNISDLNKIQSSNDTVNQSKYVWNLFLSQEGSGSTNVKVLKDFSEYLEKLNNDINPDLNSRKEIVGDNPDVMDGKPYGNNILKYPDASHGTGVAGLIGAKRNNGYGIDGVADNVRIMSIKAVPNGDEYDKDIANAIRFAVDHGAKVVNMSFGKKISPHKEWVDAAIKYAATKDVLLVQASGNDNQNVDEKPEFPNDNFLDGTTSDNLISVDASAWKQDTTLAANFTNYGIKNTDVFAPGVKVTSIDEDAEFNTADGTSFASPITAGIAALILEYYPKLTAAQVKEAILASATPLKGVMVYKPGTHDLVDFTTLSKTGGVVNAYKALEYASKMKGERRKGD
ncbi:S8 family serine peptidase [Mucilaginibacter sp. E4BP6]|uniref:S8 family serine peptidase n=1 Tax=Mucilaginibacter sp. E4BP6 TaxID=2723089 RepID=UPI0015CEEA61|nr:S8 family serine peptidase [Mucilaginibacter sp. E4BP6]NYE68536.1 subtilisin family serine protease [Mucilaginibacter sp. E4BP6]